MKKKFTEAQIVFALRQAESGTPIGRGPGDLGKPLAAAARILRKMKIGFSHGRA